MVSIMGTPCAGDTRSQGISNHDIDYVEPTQPGQATTKLMLTYKWGSAMGYCFLYVVT